MLPLVSLLLLVAIIVIGAIKTKVNIGLLAIAATLLVGVYLFEIPLKEITSFFPSSLFIMLLGITSLFTIAQENGVLDLVTKKVTNLINGSPRLLPVLFFFITFILSSIGPGNIGAVAIVAPIAITAALASGTSLFLMSIMVCTGANAGAFSPVSPTGVILIGLMQKIQVDTHTLPWIIYGAAAVIQSLGALLAYFLLQGNKVKKSIKHLAIKNVKETKVSLQSCTTDQKLTLVSIFLLILVVAVFKVSISVAAFSFAAFLLLFTDTEDIVKKLPFDAILLVTGVTVLIGLLEYSGGLDLAVKLLSIVSSGHTINAVLALVTGVISAYSSSSGVVMPAFILLLPKLVVEIPGSNITNMLISIAVGSHMVDVSPLSTLGALCIAAVPKEQRNVLFKNLMIWGLSMAVFGAALSFVILDLIF